MNQSARAVVNGSNQTAGFAPRHSYEEYRRLTSRNPSHRIRTFNFGMVVLIVELEDFNQVVRIIVSKTEPLRETLTTKMKRLCTGCGKKIGHLRQVHTPGSVKLTFRAIWRCPISSESGEFATS